MLWIEETTGAIDVTGRDKAHPCHTTLHQRKRKKPIINDDKIIMFESNQISQSAEGEKK